MIIKLWTKFFTLISFFILENFFLLWPWDHEYTRDLIPFFATMYFNLYIFAWSLSTTLHTMMTSNNNLTPNEHAARANTCTIRFSSHAQRQTAHGTSWFKGLRVKILVLYLCRTYYFIYKWNTFIVCKYQMYPGLFKEWMIWGS